METWGGTETDHEFPLLEMKVIFLADHWSGGFPASPGGPLVQYSTGQYSTVETGADDFEDPVQHVLDPAAFCDGNKAELRQGKTKRRKEIWHASPLQEEY